MRREGVNLAFALDRARTFVTLLVVIHIPSSTTLIFLQWRQDALARLRPDRTVHDSFFMAFLFLISGLFVYNSLARRRSVSFLRTRA